MKLEDEIQTLQNQKIEKIRSLWIWRFITSQVFWLMLTLYFTFGSNQTVTQSSPPPIKDHLRLVLPVTTLFPINESVIRINLYSAEKNIFLTAAHLIASSEFKNGHYLVDVPQENIKKVLDHSQESFKASPYTPQKTQPKVHHYEIFY